MTKTAAVFVGVSPGVTMLTLRTPTVARSLMVMLADASVWECMSREFTVTPPGGLNCSVEEPGVKCVFEPATSMFMVCPWMPAAGFTESTEGTVSCTSAPLLSLQVPAYRFVPRPSALVVIAETDWFPELPQPSVLACVQLSCAGE